MCGELVKKKPKTKASPLQKEIRSIGSEESAQHALRYFKCGPGQYGEGDAFLGLSVPDCRSIAKRNLMASDRELKTLLKSPYHEERLIALLILVERYQKAPQMKEKTLVLRFYLQHKEAINNWDLVDLSAYKILGDWCLRQKNHRPMSRLLKSKRHWDRRMAVVATLAFTKQRQVDLIFNFAREVLDDQEDLMHKATGWMLREGGRHFRDRLRKFLRQNIKRMPRTMLRYSIEHMSPSERAKWLAHPL